MNEAKIARISAFIYTGVSFAAAIIFLLVTWRGDYTQVERFGGAIWIFILSMIILMPVVIPFIKKKYQV